MTATQHNSPYTSADKMVTLISRDFELLQVMSRFGIPVGFGDATVGEVCRNNGVDCDTFLTVVNFVASGYHDDFLADNCRVSVEALVRYLSQSHVFFLEYCLPSIRRKLLDGISPRPSDVSFLILRFFDEYFEEVRRHMDYEEANVFRYINSLLAGEKPGDYTITTYSARHEQAAAKLKELKNLILRYCPDGRDVNILNDALYDIYRCEGELEGHCLIEDHILIPAILKLEREASQS